jgi:hypothetical protein
MEVTENDAGVIQEFEQRRYRQKIAGIFFGIPLLISWTVVFYMFLGLSEFLLMLAVFFIILIGYRQFTRSNYCCPSCGGPQVAQTHMVIWNLRYCKYCGVQLRT